MELLKFSNPNNKLRALGEKGYRVGGPVRVRMPVWLE
jgi:hypothetical protein